MFNKSVMFDMRSTNCECAIKVTWLIVVAQQYDLRKFREYLSPLPYVRIYAVLRADSK